MDVFSALKADKWPQKLTFAVKFWPAFDSFERSFLTIFWSKKTFSRLLKVVLDSFKKFLNIVFSLKRPTFGCMFSSKGLIWIRNSRFLLKFWSPGMGIFANILGQSSYLLSFFKVILKFFKKCLGIVFELNHFWLYFYLKRLTDSRNTLVWGSADALHWEISVEFWLWKIKCPGKRHRGFIGLPLGPKGCVLG